MCEDELCYVVIVEGVGGVFLLLFIKGVMVLMSKVMIFIIY